MGYEFLNAHISTTTCKMYAVFHEMNGTHYSEAFQVVKISLIPSGYLKSAAVKITLP